MGTPLLRQITLTDNAVLQKLRKLQSRGQFPGGKMGKELLLEIGTEEIPAGFIPRALEEMALLIREELHAHRIAHGEVRTLGTPRRLVLLVRDVVEKQADVEREKLGPAVRTAFDHNGKPTKAAMGFARGQGLKVEDLKIVQTDRGEYLCAVRKEEGKASSALLIEIVPRLIGSISFPKSMRWGTVEVRFARPIHWILALFGGEVISFRFGGIESGNRSYGHRFMKPRAIEVRDFRTYERKMKSAFVIVDPQERRRMIEQGIVEAAGTVSGKVLRNEGLLDEVTYLVEYPNAVVGTFDGEFLNLPREVVINAMEEHQRYFPIVDGKGDLMPHFVCVCNTRTRDMESVTRGNERVLKARLSDATFFFQEDTKEPLDRKVEALKGVIFQAQLGTSHEKVLRFKELALYLAGKFRPDLWAKVERAAMLCKADLVTGMVREFPTLQGVVGREYALISGEDEEVATALYEHYLPAFAGDRLPSEPIGDFISIADKVDTIVGCFGIGLIPTGAGDPFALRRQALGIIRILLEKGYFLSLGEILEKSLQLLREKLTLPAQQTKGAVLDFLRSRFQNLLISEGYPYDVVEAVMSAHFDDLLECRGRIEAITRLKAEEELLALATSFKRVTHITKGTSPGEVNASLLQDPSEKALFKRYLQVKGEVEKNIEEKAYEHALMKMMKLKGPIDDLFDSVLIMDEIKEKRENRLALLGNITALFFGIADFSKLVTE
jgi:glycyl-tRNA synthetase beta chain